MPSVCLGRRGRRGSTGEGKRQKSAEKAATGQVIM